jgi:ectoine hydroxylase-related dioxygenase (phytanoyl-CoA dioxygenase family)
MSIEAVAFNADAALAEARALLEARRYSEADSIVSTLLERMPNSMDVLFLKMSLCAATGLWRDGIEATLLMAERVQPEIGHTNGLWIRQTCADERLKRAAARVASRHMPGGRTAGAGYPKELPIFSADTASIPDMIAALDDYGCLVMRNAIPRDVALALQDLVRQTFTDCDAALAAHAAGQPMPKSAYFSFLAKSLTMEALQMFRAFGSIPMLEAPAPTNEFLRAIVNTKVTQLAETFLGSEPFIGSVKSSVRQSEITADVRRVFHQDATFFGGDGTATINFWVALSDAGIDRPGIEILPQKLNTELVRGQVGATVGWEVFEETIAELFGLDKLWAPVVQPGDAIVFDQMNVHRTYLTEGMTDSRFAIEAWLFPAREKYAKYGLMKI